VHASAHSLPWRLPAVIGRCMADVAATGPFRISHSPAVSFPGQQVQLLKGVAPEQLLERLFEKYGGDWEAQGTEAQSQEFQAKAYALQQKYLQQRQSAPARREASQVVVRQAQAPASVSAPDTSSLVHVEASEVPCGSASASSASSACGGATRDLLAWPGTATPARAVLCTPERRRSCSPERLRSVSVRRLSSGGLSLSFSGSANSYQPPLTVVVAASPSPASPLDRARSSTPSRIRSPGSWHSFSPPRMCQSLRVHTVHRSISRDKLSTPPVPLGSPPMLLALANPQLRIPDGGSLQRSSSASPRGSPCSVARATLRVASPRLRRHSSMQSSPFLGRVWHAASPSRAGQPPPPVALRAIPTPQTGLLGPRSSGITATVSATAVPAASCVPIVPALPAMREVRFSSPQPSRPAILYSSCSGQPLQEVRLTPSRVTRRPTDLHAESSSDFLIGHVSR